MIYGISLEKNSTQRAQLSFSVGTIEVKLVLTTEIETNE